MHGTQGGEGKALEKKLFKRECSVVAASSNDGNVPYNTRDNSLFSRWSAYGDGEYIQYKVCTDEETIDYVDIAFYLGDQRVAYFDISVSRDENAQEWETVLSGIESNTTTNEKQRFYFDPLQTNIKRIRYTGHGNSLSLWNSITEFNWGLDSTSSKKTILKDTSTNKSTVLPNPTKNSVKVISDEIISKISVYSIMGEILITKDNLNTKNFDLDLSKYSNGLYFISLKSENNTYSSFKIIKN